MVSPTYYKQCSYCTSKTPHMEVSCEVTLFEMLYILRMHSDEEFMKMCS